MSKGLPVSSMKIILASKSPRRKKLLQDAGYEVEVDVSEFDERSVRETDPARLVSEIAKGKVLKVAGKHRNSIIVAADTIVYFQGKPIGQQHSDDAAEKTLKMLAGKAHEVYTGICVINTHDGRMLQDTDVSRVYLKKISEETLGDYVRSGQYKGKAGAYNIADPEFESFVDHIEGSYSNIMGLPLEKVKAMIEKAGSGQRSDYRR
jgi:septum formation protein